MLGTQKGYAIFAQIRVEESNHFQGVLRSQFLLAGASLAPTAMNIHPAADALWFRQSDRVIVHRKPPRNGCSPINDAALILRGLIQ